MKTIQSQEFEARQGPRHSLLSIAVDQTPHVLRIVKQIQYVDLLSWEKTLLRKVVWIICIRVALHACSILKSVDCMNLTLVYKLFGLEAHTNAVGQLSYVAQYLQCLVEHRTLT